MSGNDKGVGTFLGSNRLKYGAKQKSHSFTSCLQHDFYKKNIFLIYIVTKEFTDECFCLMNFGENKNFDFKSFALQKTSETFGKIFDFKKCATLFRSTHYDEIDPIFSSPVCTLRLLTIS